jgi:hypothetical protein
MAAAVFGSRKALRALPLVLAPERGLVMEVAATEAVTAMTMATATATTATTVTIMVVEGRRSMTQTAAGLSTVLTSSEPGVACGIAKDDNLRNS